MKIAALADHMHLFHNVAKMKFEEFSCFTKNEKLEDYLRRQQGYVTTQSLPKAYVVLNEAGELIGTFTLKLKDLNSRLDLSPWLDGLVVASTHRRQGTGAFIVSQAERLALESGYSKLYLYTTNKEEWYSKLGWEAIEHTFLDKFPITVMSKHLAPKSRSLAKSLLC
jgi:N-acetylglutamate synthase-like GNAT family acetyltransferase